MPGLQAGDVAYVDLQLCVGGFKTQQVSRIARDARQARTARSVALTVVVVGGVCRCQGQMTAESRAVDGRQNTRTGVRFAADARSAGDAMLVLRLHGGLEGTMLTREIPLRTLRRKTYNKQRRFTETYSFGRQPSGAPIPTIKVVRPRFSEGESVTWPVHDTGR